MNFLKFMVHTLFGIQCPKTFCDFGLFNRLAQAGGGAYFMIFHLQKVIVLNYYAVSHFGRNNKKLVQPEILCLCFPYSKRHSVMYCKAADQ